MQRGEYASVIFDLSVFALLLFSIYSLSTNKKILMLALLLGIPASSRAFLPLGPELAIVSTLFSALFFGLVITVMTHHLFKSTTVTLDTIYGAICIYIFIGIEWGTIYNAMELYAPGTFDLAKVQHASGEIPNMAWGFIYYSFVTLTTLGFGDITPISQSARSFAIVEAVTGQIYLTVLIARLVGMHIARRK